MTTTTARNLVFVFLLSIATSLTFQTGKASTAALSLDNDRGVLTMAPMLEKVTPGVVNISVRSKVKTASNPLMQDPFFRHFFHMPRQMPERETSSAGSGVIVDADDGIILTNHHVVDNANEILITLAGNRRLEAELVGSDPLTDIAVLRVDAESLTNVVWGDSDNLKVGDYVVAIGNPFGLGQTVTTGIVSALGRQGLNIKNYENFIQTDASINPGNSGGALINSKGELIGINTAIIAPGGGNVGIGFAVPVNMARAIMEQILEDGEVQRGLLGVSIQDLSGDVAEALDLETTTGALVAAIRPDSPAEKAGIALKDVIVAVDGKAINDSGDLRNRIAFIRPGSEAEITLFRDGRKKTLTVTIGAMPQTGNQVASNNPSRTAGMALSREESGLRVRDVQPNSPAARAGLQPDDVIISIQGEDARSVEQLANAIEDTDKAVFLTIERGETQQLAVLRKSSRGSG